MATVAGAVEAPLVVLLASSVSALPAAVPWPCEMLRPRVRVCCPVEEPVQEPPDWVSREMLHPLRGRSAEAVLGRARSAGARLRSAIRARAHGVPGGYLWALKSDRELARLLRAAQVVVSLDQASEDALRISPDLARGAHVLDRSHSTPAGRLWVLLRRWDQLLEGVIVMVTETRQGRELADEMSDPLAELAGLCEELPQMVPTSISEEPARRTQLIGLRRAAQLPHRETVRLLNGVRAAVRPLGHPDLLEAAAVSAELWEARGARADADLAAVVGRATSHADAAIGRGDRELAMHLLNAAMSVALHRTRHSETLRSPLVEQPAEVLASIWASTAYRALRDERRPRPALTRKAPGPPAFPGPVLPRVTVLPGAYGEFHHDVVAALRGRAVLTVPQLAAHRSFRRRLPTASDLVLLDALRRGDVDVLGARWEGAPAGLDPSEQLTDLRALAKRLRGADVVVGEWLDASTMWASHLVPAATRMVIRAHGLDILDPWVHLIDWRAVDTVLATTPALGGLLGDLTSHAGAPEPVLVLPYRPDLVDYVRPRDPQSRFTIGMIGWGRQVKDPVFALDLLARDERRRLVLIGPPFPEVTVGAAQPYADALGERLRDPAVAARVEIVGHTDDVAAHLARVGVILSSSLREGWHLGLIEGAASGAVPVVRDWPLLASREGARSTHPPEWVVQDLAEADHRIAELADPEVWLEASRQATAHVAQRYAAAAVARDYRRLILSAPAVPDTGMAAQS